VLVQLRHLFKVKLFSKKIDGFLRKGLKKKEYVLLLSKLLLRDSRVCKYYKKVRVVSGTTRVNNQCILTGRTRAVYKSFKVSRFILKGMSSLGYLPGIRKCS
jgi:ribosomal protein S14